MVLLLSSNTIWPVVSKHHTSHLSTHKHNRTSCTLYQQYTNTVTHGCTCTKIMCECEWRVYASCDLAYIMYTCTCVVLLREVPLKIKQSAPLVVDEQSFFCSLSSLEGVLHILTTIACEHIQRKANTHHARLATHTYRTTTKSKLNCDQNRTLCKWITLYTCMHAEILCCAHHVYIHARASSDNCA